MTLDVLTSTEYRRLLVTNFYKTYLNGRAPTPQELAAAVRAAPAGEIELVCVVQGVEGRKKVLLAEAPGPTIEQRARPIADPDGPRPTEEADRTTPADARVAALEARIRELEARIQKLEARLVPAPAGDVENPK